LDTVAKLPFYIVLRAVLCKLKLSLRCVLSGCTVTSHPPCIRVVQNYLSGSLPAVHQFHSGRFCIKHYRDTMYSKDKALEMSPLPFLRKTKHAYNKYNKTTFII